jgi:hypothetical protein
MVWFDVNTDAAERMDDDSAFSDSATRKLRANQTVHLPDDILEKSELDIGGTVYLFVDEETGIVSLISWEEMIDGVIDDLD